MKDRTFKLVFLVTSAVCLLCILILAVLLHSAEPQLRLVEMFTPILIVTLLAVVLSAVLAGQISRDVTSSLHKIDFSRPDERDVEEEIKPLVRRLAEQNRQIRSQMDALAREHAQQDRMRREFTANVSHELKTPLTSISGFAELLRDGMVRPEDTQRFGGKIYEEAQRMIALVGDILRISRLEEPSGTVSVTPICLQTAAEQVQRRLEPVAAKYGVTVLVEGDRVEIESSAQIVDEILFNLCDNAIKYNRPGGTVRICVEAQQSHVLLRVKDTGIGISQEDQLRIFERFYRVDKSHSRADGSTGLGLSIVKHGAACVGAEIGVESRLGQGTEITVRFPRSWKAQA